MRGGVAEGQIMAGGPMRTCDDATIGFCSFCFCSNTNRLNTAATVNVEKKRFRAARIFPGKHGVSLFADQWLLELANGARCAIKTGTQAGEREFVDSARFCNGV